MIYIIAILCILGLAIWCMGQIWIRETFSAPVASATPGLISPEAYSDIPENHYAAEMRQEFFINALKDLVGREFEGAADKVVVDTFNDKLPANEKHKYKIVSSTDIQSVRSEELGLFTKQYIIHRDTKAIAISITIDCQVLNSKTKILLGKVDGFVFEDKVFTDHAQVDGFDFEDNTLTNGFSHPYFHLHNPSSH